MAKNKQNERKTNWWMWLWIATVAFLVIAWWFCWVLVPLIPNANCIGSASGGTFCNGGGSSGGSSSGGSNEDGTCPTYEPVICDGGTPDCRTGFTYNPITRQCDPIPDEPSNIRGCCPDTYTWDVDQKACISDRGGLSYQCPQDGIFDTGLGHCTCNDGFVQAPLTGCCVG